MTHKTYVTKEDTVYLIKMKQQSENNLGVVAHACHISTQKLGQEKSQIGGQPGLHNMTLF